MLHLQKIALSAILLPLLCWQCSSGPLKPDALARYVCDPDNGLLQRVQIQGLHIDLQYRPASLVALQQIKETVRPVTKETEYAAALTDAQYFLSFELTLRPATPQTFEEALGSRIHNKDSLEVLKHYLQYTLQQDLWLRIGADSIPCAFYHPLATGRLNNACESFLAFEAPPDSSWQSEPIEVVLRAPLLHATPIRFYFEPLSFQKIPALTL